MNLDTRKVVIVTIVGAILFTGGYGFRSFQDQIYSEPWNDGLIEIKCVGSADGETHRFVAKGMVAYHRGDGPSDARIMLSPAWDPVTRTTEPERPEIIVSEYGLGCFVNGLTKKEIMERSDDQRSAYWS